MGSALGLALGLLARGDAELFAVLGLSLRVSLTAAALAFMLGLPLAAALAMVERFPGRGAVLLGTNTLLGLPPVVVGLVLYLLLSRDGPLGGFGVLFTPAAMVLAQAALGVPIVVALGHRALAPPWAEYGDALRLDGAGPVRATLVLLGIARAALVTVFLAGFGRAIAEVGAVLVVGGNIRGSTRTMTTAIALETSRGDLPMALALGMVLLMVSLAVTALAFGLSRAAPR